MLVVAVAVLLSLKAILMLAAPPLGDEAYYWMWGQHLDWSYHDHPPLNALFLRASYELFGWNIFALRAPGLLSFAVSAWIIGWWARRLGTVVMPTPALAGIAVFLASPLMFIFTTLALPDHLLIAFLLISGHFFVLYAHSAEDARGRPVFLFAAAAALGLAALSKYSAVFVGVGFVWWFFATPAGRRQLATPYPWLAGLLALAIQAPVIWWNLQHDLSTVRFHFGGRFPSGWNAYQIPQRLAVFLLFITFFFSPFLLPALRRFLSRRDVGDVAAFRAVTLPTFASTMLVFSAFTAGIIALFYWVIPAVVLFYPVAIGFVGTALRRVFVFGLVVAALLIVNLSVVPIAALVGGKSPDDASFGWAGVADWVGREAARHDAGLLLASQYNLAAMLGFALRRTDVYSISERNEQYDYWFDPSLHVGQTALFLTDTHRPLESGQRDHFERIERIGSFETSRFGLPLNSFTLYLGTGMRAQPKCCNEVATTP